MNGRFSKQLLLGSLFCIVLSGSIAWGQESELTIVTVEGSTAAVADPRMTMPSGYVTELSSVDPEKLRRNFEGFMAKISEAFATKPRAFQGFSMDEIELNVQITAEGGFRLIGQATVGTVAGITIILKRNPK